MPLEATMLLIDNSAYMLNADYPPTRFAAQSDAVTSIFTAKTDSNAENTIGLLTTAGPAPEVLVTNTKDLGAVLAALYRASAKLGGNPDLVTAINVATLALKHRENKNLRQRILLLSASPTPDTPAYSEAALIKLGKRLKKNNVALDLVLSGDALPPSPALRALVDAANASDNSRLLAVAPDPSRLLSDAVLASPVLAADRGIPEGLDDAEGGPSTGATHEYGVDPSIDPELAMALRMSMEDEAQRIAAEEAASRPAAAAAPADSEMDDEDEELAKALAMSQGGQDVDMDDDEGDGDEDEDEDEDEEAAIAKAIAMSMEENKEKQGEKKK